MKCFLIKIQLKVPIIIVNILYSLFMRYQSFRVTSIFNYFVKYFYKYTHSIKNIYLEKIAPTSKQEIQLVE